MSSTLFSHESKVDLSAPIFSRFPSRRSVVYSTRGIVAATQPLACQAGLDILKAGGNAVDAAVATAAALGVTEPMSTGLGGDMFMLFWNEKEGRVYALNGSGRSPSALSIDRCRQMGFESKLLPPQSVNTVTVPGQVAGWMDALEIHGSHKLSTEEVLRSAIELCETGYPVSEITARQWGECERLLARASPSGHDLLRKDGKAPRAGEIFNNPRLGKVLREIASKGKAGFYQGWVADSIVEVVGNLGGVLTAEDLRNHTSTQVEPISLTRGDVTLWECPPNGQGIIALEALGILGSLESSGKLPPLESLGHNTLPYAHAVIEALRYAFADGDAYISDVEIEDIPVDRLLDPGFLLERAQNFRQDKADPTVAHGFPSHASDTVYLTTSDSEGNACSFIASNASNFGCGVVPSGCGFALQNRGAQFHLLPGHINSLKPNKRPYHTIMPGMVTKNGQLELSYAVMGGYMQPQAQLQVLLNTSVFGFNSQDSLDAPRLCIRPIRAMPEYATQDSHAELTQKSIVSLEDGFSNDVVEGLRKLGHQVEVVRGWDRAMFGRGQIIQRRDDPDGRRVYCAGSDLRGDGHAVPL